MVYLINHIPTFVLQNESLFNSSYFWLYFLYTFRCLCFPFLHSYNAYKLAFASSPFVFLGYNSFHLAYHYLYMSSQPIYISCHICFHEHVFNFDTSEWLASLNPPSMPYNVTTHLPILLHSLIFNSSTFKASPQPILHSFPAESCQLILSHASLSSYHSPSKGSLHL